jgi:hypothetical protein
VLLFRTLILSIIVFAGCSSDQGFTVKPRFANNPEGFAWLKRNLSKPTAKPERAFSYEGEEIFIDASVSFKSADDSVNFYKEYEESFFAIEPALRIFQDTLELTSVLDFTRPKIPNDEIVPRLKLHPSFGPSKRSYLINIHRSLSPGEYWGIYDAGILSDKFSFEIVPLPDSLAEMRNLHMAILRHPESQETIVKYSKLLLSLQSGAPLRMEGLRACLSRLTGSLWENGISDSTLVLNVLQQYISEPRAHPQEALYAVRDYFNDQEEPYHEERHEDEMVRFANEWGNDSVASFITEQMGAYKQWREERKNRQ